MTTMPNEMRIREMIPTKNGNRKTLWKPGLHKGKPFITYTWKPEGGGRPKKNGAHEFKGPRD